MNYLKRLYYFVLDIVKSFINDDCYGKASALAFYSALSVVPLLAVLFGIAKGFGFEKALESEISTQVFQQREVSSKLIQFAHSWLQSVKGGVIAGFGTILLLWSVISLLVSIEGSLNEIWKIKEGRNFVNKIRDYLTVIFIAPLFIVASSSINIYLITEITKSAHSNVFTEVISPFLLYFMQLFPFFLFWILFTFIYLFIPNKRVYFREAFVAGIIAGTAFQLWQWVYIQFQVNLASYGAIYGSFAAIPLFLFWLQVSWLIVLAGAEIAVAIENGFFMRVHHSKLLSLKTVAALIVYTAVKAFSKGEPPLTDLQFQNKLGISLDQIRRVLEILIKGRVLSETNVRDNSQGYQPARSIHDITLQKVFDVIDESDLIEAFVEDLNDLQKIEHVMNEISKGEHDLKANQSFHSLINS